jgi:hypothetical protein
MRKPVLQWISVATVLVLGLALVLLTKAYTQRSESTMENSFVGKHRSSVTKQEWEPRDLLRAQQASLRSCSPNLVELDFRWDEKADSSRSTLCCVGLQAYANTMWAQNGRRIGP